MKKTTYLFKNFKLHHQKMKKKILLIDDWLTSKPLKRELEHSEQFDVSITHNRPKDILEEIETWLYEALIMESRTFLDDFFNMKKLIEFKKKFWEKIIDPNAEIPINDKDLEKIYWKDVASNNELEEVELCRNIGLWIYDQIRSLEKTKEMPIIFYTNRDLHNLFIAWFLDKSNTFHIEKPELYSIIKKKLKKILSHKKDISNNIEKPYISSN